MKELGVRPHNFSITDLGIKEGIAHWNLSPEELASISLRQGSAVVTSSGAIAVDTGEFTGRSPKDKFIVKDEISKNKVWWNNFNIPFDAVKFGLLYRKMLRYFEGKEFYVRDVYACADPGYRVGIRIINEFPWSNMFA